MVPVKGRKRTVSPGKAPRPQRPRPSSPKIVIPQFPIVGIGASAGGLEAFLSLFKALPANTGMGFVVIQHMDPSKESLLVDILARAIRIPIVEAKDGMPVMPERIHVIPPGTNMGIANGRLTLVPRTETRGLHLPIDFFFRSLARDRSTQAIGVVLSGNGSDGTQGVRAIKAEGGVTFAQDEKSAKYGAMPASAVASGSIDFVLSPERIAAELARFGAHPYVARTAEAPAHDLLGEAEEDVARIFLLVRDTTGVDFSQYKPSTTKRRILRRMALHKIENMKVYAQRLQEDPREIDALFEDFLINVTSFFRDPEIFELLKKTVFPAMFQGRAPSDTIRIWVPACSTGEEAYSIAMIALEAMREKETSISLQVFATDINDSALETARAGSYPEGIAQDVSPERLRKFFAKTSSGYQINKAIRESCIFARQNLAKDPPFSRLDLVSCRNVLIYMKPILHKKILSTFHYALKQGGILLLGNSETVGEMSDLFGIVDRKARIYARNTVLYRPAVDFGVPQHDHETLLARRRAAEAAPSVEAMQREADKVVLTHYSPPGVVVNDRLDIIQFRGQTAPYIAPSPGTASLNIARLAREGLVPDLRMAIRKARAEGGAVRKYGVRVAANGRQKEITLHVIPIRLAGLKEDHFMVLFEEAPRIPEGAVDRNALRKGAKLTREREQYIAHVETELATTKEYLQTVGEEYEATNEELRSANEEIQSSNEELQSTNEELETAKEELQSTNEELVTVNEALANRNSELGQLNNDLTNLLASVNVPLVMVGSNLRIRRFTTSAEKLLSLIPTDIGRPISDISPNVPLPDLGAKIQEVLETLVVNEEEIKDREGRNYIVRVRPYRTEDNKIDGAVVALFDVTAMKSQQRRDDIVQVVQQVINGLPAPVFLLDTARRMRGANRSFYRAFRTTPEETENRLLGELGNGQWNNRELEALLESVLARKAGIRDIRMTLDFPATGRTPVRVGADLVRGPRQEEDTVIVVVGKAPADASAEPSPW